MAYFFRFYPDFGYITKKCIELKVIDYMRMRSMRINTSVVCYNVTIQQRLERTLRMTRRMA